jgi:hypothetical protein
VLDFAQTAVKGSWVLVNEAKHFVWPRYDLRKIPAVMRFAIGLLPPLVSMKSSSRSGRTASARWSIAVQDLEGKLDDTNARNMTPVIVVLCHYHGLVARLIIAGLKYHAPC